MIKQDLLEIKAIVDASVEKAIDSSVRAIVQETLIENNKNLVTKQDLEDEFNEFGLLMAKQFNKIERRFDDIETELKRKLNRDEVPFWADDRFRGLEVDMNKVKFLHKKEWLNLPQLAVIKRGLVRAGIK